MTHCHTLCRRPYRASKQTAKSKIAEQLTSKASGPEAKGAAKKKQQPHTTPEEYLSSTSGKYSIYCPHCRVFCSCHLCPLCVCLLITCFACVWLHTGDPSVVEQMAVDRIVKMRAELEEQVENYTHAKKRQQKPKPLEYQKLPGVDDGITFATVLSPVKSFTGQSRYLSGKTPVKPSISPALAAKAGALARVQISDSVHHPNNVASSVTAAPIHTSVSVDHGSSSSQTGGGIRSVSVNHVTDSGKVRIYSAVPIPQSFGLMVPISQPPDVPSNGEGNLGIPVQQQRMQMTPVAHIVTPQNSNVAQIQSVGSTGSTSTSRMVQVSVGVCWHL